METEKLYNLAKQLDIRLDYFPLPQTKSVTVCMNDRYYIAIDPRQVATPANERVCLAHELGHCQTNSFYNMYSPFDLRDKHEHKADKWAIHQLIPLDELKKALKCGCTDIAALADYFSVTEDFVNKALKYYTCN